MKFYNKIAWITGGSSGIGEALAYSLLKEGAKVIISSNMENELLRVKDNCQNLGYDCYILPFDLSDPGQIKEAVSKVTGEFKNVDLLINNGGISQRSPILETSVEMERKIMEINFYGAVYLTKALVPYMINNGGGHIAVTSSISGKFGFPLRAAYSASKHALHGFFETLRAELKNKNIKVTILCPGRVKTNISVNALTKNGTSYGKMSKGQDNGISPEKCAKKYLSAIKRNKKDVNIGSVEIFMVYLKRLFPGIFYKIVSKINPE